jgi:hypothetical protein
VLTRAPCVKKWSGGGKGGAVAATGAFYSGAAGWGTGRWRAPRPAGVSDRCSAVMPRGRHETGERRG